MISGGILNATTRLNMEAMTVEIRIRENIEALAVEKHKRQNGTAVPRVRIGEDCSTAATGCSYFRPIQFMAEYKKSHPVRPRKAADLFRCYKNMVELYDISCGQPDIHHVTGEERCELYLRESKKTLDLPPNFAYKKLYKTGGTSIDTVLLRYPRNAVVRKFRPLRPGQNMTEAQHFMKDVANDQMGGVPRPVIAVVRDPVERFVSAASQLLNMKGRLRQCNGGNRTAELMKCAIDALVGGHRDPHFESMVADLHCIVGHLHDVQFSVYPMDTVPAVLNALGAENPNEKINSKNYKNIILKVSDMDEKMIRDVCQWYLADVTMMRSLGFSVPHC